MNNFKNKALVLACLLCFFVNTLWAQQNTSSVKHELNFQAGIGMSGEMDIEYYNPYNVYNPFVSTAFSLSYHVLFLQEQLNVGIGIGGQTKGSSIAYQRIYNNIEPYLSHYHQTSISLPIELGYRLKITPETALLFDGLIIPFWSLLSTAVHKQGDNVFATEQYDGGFNVDFGLQLGYRMQFSERLSGQLAFRGTISPFDSSTNDPYSFSIEYYTLRLHLGINYRLGAVL